MCALLMTSSHSEGVTWSKAGVEVPLEFPGQTWVATGPPTGIELAGGAGILVPADHINSGNWGSHALINTDMKTFKTSAWKLSTPIDDLSNGGGNECQAAQLPNGTIVMNMRTKNSYRQFSWSHDNGATWSAPGTLPPPLVYECSELCRCTPVGSFCD